MELIIIVAMARNRVIGKGNKIPWHQPADLKRFKKLTMGHPIVMGRKTFESLPGLLPGRRHVVLTRNKSYFAQNCDVVASWHEMEVLLAGSRKVCAIGGADIHLLALPHAEKLYLTLVHAELEGDTFFPDWNRSDWREEGREFLPRDENNKYDMEFIQYQRIASGNP